MSRGSSKPTHVILEAVGRERQWREIHDLPSRQWRRRGLPQLSGVYGQLQEFSRNMASERNMKYELSAHLTRNSLYSTAPEEGEKRMADGIWSKDRRNNPFADYSKASPIGWCNFWTRLNQEMQLNQPHLRVSSYRRPY